MRNSLYIPCRFRSHGVHKEHGEGSRKALKTSVTSVPLCETHCPSHAVLDLTEITEDTEGGEGNEVLCASVRNSASPGVHKEHGEGSRKALKTSVTSVPLCETHCPSHAVLDLTEITEDTEGGEGNEVLCASVRNSASPGVHKNHEEGADRALKNLCDLCASVRNSLSLPCRFRSHGDHRGHRGGRRK